MKPVYKNNTGDLCGVAVERVFLKVLSSEPYSRVIPSSIDDRSNSKMCAGRVVRRLIFFMALSTTPLEVTFISFALPSRLRAIAWITSKQRSKAGLSVWSLQPRRTVEVWSVQRQIRYGSCKELELAPRPPARSAHNRVTRNVTKSMPVGKPTGILLGLTVPVLPNGSGA